MKVLQKDVPANPYDKVVLALRYLIGSLAAVGLAAWALPDTSLATRWLHALVTVVVLDFVVGEQAGNGIRWGIGFSLGVLTIAPGIASKI